ncbi:MAG: hypothetical protein R3E58_16030 [Phycisphaerae bacterium]
MTGPTPPGTGVISDAFWRYLIEEHVANHAERACLASSAGTELMPTSMTPPSLDMISRNHLRHTGGCDEDVGVFRVGHQVVGVLVAGVDGRFFGDQGEGNGFADDVALPDDGDVFSAKFDLGFIEDGMNRQRGTRALIGVP